MSRQVSIIYLREGRKVRARGLVLDMGPKGMIKVKPHRKYWNAVWISPQEAQAGKAKPAPIERKPAKKHPKTMSNQPPPPKPHDPTQTKDGGGLDDATCCASFVRMFKPQFAPLVEAGTKLQTVRPTPKRMPKPGDKISLRCWRDKPYRSKQRVLMESTITRVASFRMSYDDKNGMTWWEMEMDGAPMDSLEALQFAKSDGFASVPEMAEWFRATHGLPFVGIVIHWHNA